MCHSTLSGTDIVESGWSTRRALLPDVGLFSLFRNFSFLLACGPLERCPSVFFLSLKPKANQLIRDGSKLCSLSNLTAKEQNAANGQCHGHRGGCGKQYASLVQAPVRLGLDDGNYLEYEESTR